jgi:hypothetical protein
MIRRKNTPVYPVQGPSARKTHYARTPPIIVGGFIAVLMIAGGIAGCTASQPASDSTPSVASPVAAQPSAAASPTPTVTAPHRHRHAARSAVPQAIRRYTGSACDPSLWKDIYHAYRLHVVSACKTVTGTVADVRTEPDGDVHILLELPSGQSGLLNSGNFADTHGDLVAEIICAGPVSQADAIADCGRVAAHPAVPSAGEQVRISGSYVLDADHGWMEIHPVSRLVVLGYRAAPAPPPSTQAAAPPPPAAAPPAPAACHPMTSSGNCYEPGEFCSVAEHGETGVAGDGKTITCVANGSYWRWS